MRFSNRIMNFSNRTKFCIFAVKSDGSSNISQNVQNLFFLKIKRDGFFGKESGFSQKWLKMANLFQNATQLVGFLKTFKSWFFQKTSSVFQKRVFNFLKRAKGSKVAVDCE